MSWWSGWAVSTGLAAVDLVTKKGLAKAPRRWNTPDVKMENEFAASSCLCAAQLRPIIIRACECWIFWLCCGRMEIQSQSLKPGLWSFIHWYCGWFWTAWRLEVEVPVARPCCFWVSHCSSWSKCSQESGSNQILSSWARCEWWRSLDDDWLHLV